MPIDRTAIHEVGPMIEDDLRAIRGGLYALLNMVNGMDRQQGEAVAFVVERMEAHSDGLWEMFFSGEAEEEHDPPDPPAA